MKTTYWKTLAALLLALVLLVSATAFGEARYPALGGTVVDDANVLSQTMAKDIAAYAEKLTAETDVKVHVALVLFLDGENPQAYADALFTRWELGADDLLLVGAVAEDTFAVASGATVRGKLSAANQNNLLYASGFADAFKAQRYDAAFGTLFGALNDLVAKQYGTEIRLGQLFSAYQSAEQPATAASQTATAASQTATAASQTATAASQTVAAAAQTAADAAAAVQSAVGTVVDTTNALWNSTMAAISNNVQTYKADRQQRDEGGGMSAGGWIVLALIALIVFGQGNRARRARYQGGGCGCSPLGWIIGGLGLGALFGRRDRDWQQTRDGEAYGDWRRDWRHDRDWRRDRDCRHGCNRDGRPPRW